MSKSKAVLIVGGSGFLGTHLALKLREQHKVFMTYARHQISIPGVTGIPAPMLERDWLKRVILLTSPQVIIYAVGNNDMEWCELNEREANHLHADSAVNVLNASTALQPKFIYISNNYTFDGKHGNYHEGDTLIPATVLGKSKVSGENYIKGRSLNYVVVRSVPVYGRGNGKNLSFLDRLRITLSMKQRVDLPSTELHNFAPVDGLVELISHLIDAGFKNQPIHYGGLTRLTFFELGREFAKFFGFDANLIHEKKAPEVKGIKIGPSYDYSLNVSEAAKSLNIKPLLLQEGFELFQKNLVTHF